MNAEIDKIVSSPNLSDANVPIDKAVPFVFSTYFQGKLRLFADRLAAASASVLHNPYNPGRRPEPLAAPLAMPGRVINAT